MAAQGRPTLAAAVLHTVLGGEQASPNLLLLCTVDVKVIIHYAILTDAHVTLREFIIFNGLLRNSFHFLLLVDFFRAIISLSVFVSGLLPLVVQVLVNVCQWRLIFI